MENNKLIKGIGSLLLFGGLIFMVLTWVLNDNINLVMLGLVTCSIGSLILGYLSKKEAKE